MGLYKGRSRNIDIRNIMRRLFFIGIAMDLSNIALAELKSILAQIPKEIERREKEEKIKE